MIARKYTLVLTVATILFINLLSSCSKFDCTCEDDLDSNKTNIRVKNTSDYNFQNISIDPYSDLQNYGDVKKNKSSCYLNFERAYDYAYVEVTIKGEEFQLFPIDYVGEEELGPGKFTYSIDVIDFDEKRLSITVSKD